VVGGGGGGWWLGLGARKFGCPEKFPWGFFGVFCEVEGHPSNGGGDWLLMSLGESIDALLPRIVGGSIEGPSCMSGVVRKTIGASRSRDLGALRKGGRVG